MATAVPSRFACLKIEDDDYRPRNPNKIKDQSNQNKKKLTTKPDFKSGGDTNKNVSKQTNKNGQVKSSTQSKKKKPEKNVEQWDQWIQKDVEMVDGTYEDDMQQAILLSKLEFEEKKQSKKHSTIDKKAETTDPKDVKKQRKSKAMSLEQFKNMGSGSSPVQNGHSPELLEEKEDPEFFNRTEQEAAREIVKEQFREQVQARQPPTTEMITSSQFRDQLEEKDEELQRLRLEVDTLKAELLSVKSRNKKLYHILGQGEMREKAELVVEVDKLTRVREELTTEVESLHAQLQQEKSKTTRTTDKDHKGKDKKKRDNA